MYPSPVRRALWSAALIAVSPLALLAQQGGVLTGRVTDAGSNAPIPNVQVMVVGTTRGTYTGDDGRYRIAGITPATVTVRFLRIGYQAQTRTVTIGAGATANVDASLKASAVTLEQ